MPSATPTWVRLRSVASDVHPAATAPSRNGSTTLYAAVFSSATRNGAARSGVIVSDCTSSSSPAIVRSSSVVASTARRWRIDERRRRVEQREQRRVQGEVAREQTCRERLPLSRGPFSTGSDRGVVGAADQVRGAVPHPVAVDEVVVHAQTEVQQLLGARDLGEQVRIGAAHAQIRRRDQPRTHVLATIGSLGIVDQPGHRRADIGAPGAHPLPQRRRRSRRGGGERLHERREAIGSNITASIRRRNRRPRPPRSPVLASLVLLRRR